MPDRSTCPPRTWRGGGVYQRAVVSSCDMCYCSVTVRYTPLEDGIVLRPEIQAGFLKELVTGEPQEWARIEWREMYEVCWLQRETQFRQKHKRKRQEIQRSKMSLIVQLWASRNLGKKSKVLLQGSCLYSRRFYKIEWKSQNHILEKAFWV